MPWGRGRRNSLPLLQPPTLQVLEVLTAAVEYGLEELREVGLYDGPLSHFSFLLWAPFTPCLMHTLAWRGMCTDTEYGRLSV